MSYLETIYNENVRPKTDYPNLLAIYLVNRFGILPGARILDNGCGRGDFLQGFINCGMECYGTDLEEGTIIFSGGGHISGGVDLEKNVLPYEDNYFDVVFSKSVIEHIHSPSNYLNEMKRVLKPGGRIIIMVPDWQTCMYIYYDDFSHVQPYTRVGLHDTLEVFGFREVMSEQFYQLPIVWKHPIIKVLCKILYLILGPVKKIYRNKFIRFSRELILLGTGIK